MKNRLPVILHVFFWLLAFIITVVLSIGNGKFTLHEVMIVFVLYGIINMSIFYINYLILIPSLVELRKKYMWYMVALLVLLFGMSAVKGAVAIFNSDVILVYTKGGKKMTTPIYHYLLSAVFITGFFIVISSLLKFTISWFSGEKTKQALVTEKKSMELAFLKSQLNPHFLFNSLNNIYSLAYQKSDKTPEAILKLSEIMRYMIYESNDNRVGLKKEIAYLMSFIELQKLRFKAGAFVEFNINGEIGTQEVVPLILISFVENAFKHGVANDPANPIKINITANQKILHFSIKNKKAKQNKDQMGGVGLANVKRRLDLLYPERYKLMVANAAEEYSCELIIDL